MGNYMLDTSSTVQCLHAGQAQAAGSSPRVKLGGQPIVTQSNSFTVSGCTMPPPNAGNGPCVTAMWTSAATRVKAGGVPVLTKDSQATCTPTATGLTILNTQMRVKAT
jgi:uncharacterized Zn-binding protein involved in type VI secretion